MTILANIKHAEGTNMMSIQRNLKPMGPCLKPMVIKFVLFNARTVKHQKLMKVNTISESYCLP